MSEPKVIKLREPVQFGSETITELTLKPTARSMRDFVIATKGDGTMLFEPYAAAKVGVHMAGQTNAVLDLLHPADVMVIATAVMDFFGGGLPTGGTLSPQ